MRIRLAIIAFAVASNCFGGAIVAGFNTKADGRNDDGTYANPAGCTNPSSGGTCTGNAQNVGFEINFFGVLFDSVFINTNGNVTLDAQLSTFTPFNLTSTNRQIIAPFFADVDTRNAASGVTSFGSGTFDGRTAFGVNWIDVGYYSSQANKLNSFQLLLVDRTDTGAGNFDIIFNYDKIQWETGGASGGSNGLGGDSARAGFSNGTGTPGTSLELTGSAIDGALLDGGVNSLIAHSLNSDVDGRYIFFARNGVVSTGVPEPSTWILSASGLAMLAWARRRRS
jgi:hypothetical protein